MIRLSFALLLLTSLISLSEPVEWASSEGGNEHYYEAVTFGCDWFTAKNMAAGMEFNGLPGHLVTFTSSEEEEFVWSHFDGFEWWLGAEQPMGQCPPECDGEDPLGFDGGWVWVTAGEEWGYTSWGDVNPNGGNEDCLMYRHTYPGWNDDECWETLQGFIVEYEEGSVAAHEIQFSTLKTLY